MCRLLLVLLKMKHTICVNVSIRQWRVDEIIRGVSNGEAFRACSSLKKFFFFKVFYFPASSELFKLVSKISRLPQWITKKYFTISWRSKESTNRLTKCRWIHERHVSCGYMKDTNRKIERNFTWKCKIADVNAHHNECAEQT